MLYLVQKRRSIDLEALKLRYVSSGYWRLLLLL